MFVCVGLIRLKRLEIYQRSMF